MVSVAEQHPVDVDEDHRDTVSKRMARMHTRDRWADNPVIDYGVSCGIGNGEVAVQCCAGILDAFVVFFNRSQESTEPSRKATK
jgi:hypothetical protein